DTGVGKSSIVCRFVQDHFDHNISPTIGASFMTKTVPCGNELHKFLIWDTAGQERVSISFRRFLGLRLDSIRCK
ncbi:Ras-related protein Rab-31, partial [Tupaia chinensis]